MANNHPPEAQNLADSRAAFEKHWQDHGITGTKQDELLKAEAWVTWQAREPEIEALRAQVMPEREVAVEIMARAIHNVAQDGMQEEFTEDWEDVSDLAKPHYVKMASDSYDALLAHMQRHAGEGK